MPSTYTADPTAADSPSVAPDEDAVPTVTLPADGDPPNAATFAQALKVGPDWIAWLKKPFAKVSAWTQAVMKWQNARKQDQFLIDHMGLPGGRWLTMHERWRGGEAQSGTGTVAFVATSMGWQATVNNAAGSGSLVVVDPDPNSILERHLSIQLGTGSTDYCKLVGEKVALFGAANGIVMEWDVFVGASSTNNYRLAVGLVNPAFNLFGDDNSMIGGVVFKDDGTGADWYSITGNGSALDTAQDSGQSIAASTLFHFRMEYHSVGVADDTTAAIRFYMGSVLIGTFTGSLPVAGAASSLAAPVIAVKRVAGSAARSFGVSPIRITYIR